MKNKLNKILSLSLLFLILMMNMNILMPKSNAKSKKKYYLKIDRAPVITVKRDNEKYLIFKLKDESGIKKIKVEEETDDKYKTVNNKYLDISKDKKTLKIKRELFEVDKTKRIRITAHDNDKNSNKIIKTYMVNRTKKKTKGGNYFLVNYSPNAEVKASYKKGADKSVIEKTTILKFMITDKYDDSIDKAGVKYVELIDQPVGEAVYCSDEKKINVPKVIKYPLKWLIKDGDRQIIRILSYDFSGLNTTEDVCFTIEEKK